MPAPDLDDLDAFAAIVRAGGFRIAAARRGVSASALSEALRRLEAKLGVRWSNRTTRAMTLTDAGAQLYERLFRRAMRGATLELDLDGDGVVDERRAMSAIQLRRE